MHRLRRCEEICEYKAPRIEEVSQACFKSRINEALCKGCGSCAVACCSRAIRAKNFKTEQILTMIEACLSKELEKSEKEEAKT